MREDLVTVARYANSAEANLAKNRLENAGVLSFLVDDNATALGWPLAGALMVTRLQVASGNLERARAVLADSTFAEVREAEEAPEVPAGPKEGEGLLLPGEEGFTEEDEEIEFWTQRDRNADRAFQGAVLCLIFLPLELYVFWLLLKVYVSEEELHPAKRWKVVGAWLINLPIVVVFVWLMSWVLPF